MVDGDVVRGQLFLDMRMQDDCETCYGKLAALSRSRMVVGTSPRSLECREGLCFMAL